MGSSDAQKPTSNKSSAHDRVVMRAQQESRVPEFGARHAGESLREHDVRFAVDLEYRVEVADRLGSRMFRDKRNGDAGVQPVQQFGLHVDDLTRSPPGMG